MIPPTAPHESDKKLGTLREVASHHQAHGDVAQQHEQLRERHEAICRRLSGLLDKQNKH
jgi:hypothetical protein